MTYDYLKAWLLLAGFGYRSHLVSNPSLEGDSFYRKTGRTYYEFIIVNFPGDARIIVSSRNTYDVFLIPGEAAGYIRSILGD